MTGSGEVWASFTHDPRDPTYAGLRASDLDRSVAQDVVAGAYADGRLDRVEYDERSAAIAATRTLGDLTAYVTDLVPVAPRARRAGTDLTWAGPDEIRARAVTSWRSDVRDAAVGFLVPSLICVVIWSIVMFGDFFWPGFVMLGTGINLLQVVLRRNDLIEGHVRSLETKQAKEQAKELRARERDDPDQTG